MPNFQTLTLPIKEKSTIAKDTFLLRFVKPDGSNFDFQAGQFVTVTVAPNVKRSYSIASQPGVPYLDLIADNRRGGPGSQFFTNAVEEQQVEMLFPLGNFVYEDNPRPVYFFGTGTGIVPFLSMIEYALTQLHTTRPISFYCGFRFLEEVFGSEDMELLDIQYENFIYKLNLTQPPADWEGQTGRITQYIETLPGTDCDCYVCGSNQMVTDVTAQLIAKGVPEAQVHHEMFY